MNFLYLTSTQIFPSIFPLGTADILIMEKKMTWCTELGWRAPFWKMVFDAYRIKWVRVAFYRMGNSCFTGKSFRDTTA